jgi:NAD(P)-dependent dehydrogenase (short-subunit alcohol dehydrogenase family)
MELKNKIVVVTGGGNGIGEALVKRFHLEGAKALVVADLDGEAASQVAKEVGGLSVQMDVSKESEIIDLVEHTEQEIGPIDLFCSNAGIAGHSNLTTPIDEWQRLWDVNVMSQIYAARAVVPRMIERGGGYLLNTSSAAGLLNQIGSASYGVTKHASVGFGEWVSLTHGHQGIKVSMLCPQAVRTAMVADGSAVAQAAGVDGMLEPDELAIAVVEGLRQESFLILPHPEVLDYMRRKTADYDRWVKGMNRLQQKLEGL